MAGDWIKMQKDTPDKPEVLAIASRLSIDPDAVTGKLVRIWSWFDTHTTDGNASCVTYAFLDRLAGVTGFAEQMALVGWLLQNGHDLSLPNFDYHTGETAKKRALGQKRQVKHRSNAERNASSVTKASPEKRREEKSYSVTNVTGDKSPEEMTKDELWSVGKSLLSASMPAKQCGSFVGKLVKDYGDAIVIDAVRAAVVARPADPAEYIKATCQHAAGLRQRQQPVSFAQQDELARRKRWEEMTGRKWPESEEIPAFIDIETKTVQELPQ